MKTRKDRPLYCRVMIEPFVRWESLAQPGAPVDVQKGKLLGRKVFSKFAGIVTPDTILRWYRQLIAEKHDGSKRIGQELSRSTIKRILKEAGIVPASERGEKTPWKTFLKAHWEALAATDFYTARVLTLRGLIRYHVLGHFAERFHAKFTSSEFPYRTW